jgi:hypothetical protein
MDQSCALRRCRRLVTDCVGAGRERTSLAAELDQTGARSKVLAAHEVFVALNARFLVAITNWQIRPRGGDQLAANDHTDWCWDERVLDELHGLQGRLQPVCDGLVAGLARFAGYTERYSAALARVDRGERAWVAQPKIDSCHTVWMELHEDLLATLGLERGS